MDLGLRGKFAIVTGGSHGIGAAIANALAAEGCVVMPWSRAHGVDALSDTSIEAAIVETKPPDILINNVGGGGRWGAPTVEETPDGVWAQVYQKNAGVASRLTCWAIPAMRAKKWGRVITITSFIGGKDGVGRPWFVMAKAAETALMKSLATTPYLVRDGITFNSVAPGDIFIKGTGTDEEARANPDKFLDHLDGLPMGRMGRAEEVASVVAFLCSEQASFVNGANILVDGAQSHGI